MDVNSIIVVLPALSSSSRVPTANSCTGSGTVDVKELKAALAAMGQHPSDEELFVMIHDVSLPNSTAGWHSAQAQPVSAALMQDVCKPHDLGA